MVDYTFKVSNRKDIEACSRIRVDRRNLKELEDASAYSRTHWHYFMNNVFSMVIWSFIDLPKQATECF